MVIYRDYLVWERCQLVNAFMKWWRGVHEPGFQVVYLKEEHLHAIPEEEESIRALLHHPGWVALNRRLRLRASALDARLHIRQETLRDYDRLQCGIEAYGWLQSEIDKAVAKKQEIRAVAPKPGDLEQFKQVLSQIESV